MRPSFLAAVLAAAAFLAASPAFAQLENPDNNGRYQIVNGVVSPGAGGAEQRVTVLLDTQFGRTWMMTTGPAGIHWVRLQMKFVGKVPENMMLRPGPVTPFTPPK